MKKESREDTVEMDEMLARFVYHGSHIRADQTLRLDAFMPDPYTELSVTRHAGLVEAEIWRIAEGVAVQRQQTLHGRGDALARVYIGERLAVRPDPVPGNPQHASVSNWPEEKSARKAIAQMIARSARFLPRPRS